MFKVLVCGGRDYNDKPELYYILDRFDKKFPISLVIQGGAKGADLLAKKWAIDRNKVYLQVDAKWDKYGKSAGYKRNVEMADMKPHFVIAFRGGRGTNMMIRIARERKIKVLHIK